MLASALNPPAHGKSSILPLLAASYQNLPEVEGVIRPRLPVIQTKSSVNGADEQEEDDVEDDVESANGFYDEMNDASEEAATIAPPYGSLPPGNAGDSAPIPATAVASDDAEPGMRDNISGFSQPTAYSDLGKRQAEEALLSAQHSKRARYDVDTADIANTEPASHFTLPSAPVDVPSADGAGTETHTTTILPTQDFTTNSGALVQRTGTQGDEDEDDDDDDDFEVPTLVMGVDSDSD